ncbi:MAG: hypothetical protein CFE31_00350 [Rhizobiales bacterium PAR1]|nr:MAG: hypothetical protein CFE31_00350 [Rhizobiales bacterium PAR1]
MTIRATVLALAAASLFPTLADAQTRVPLASMTCSAATAFLEAQGVVIFSTGPETYERVVRDGGYCMRTEVARPFMGPSRDNPQCIVGALCSQIEGDNQ